MPPALCCSIFRVVIGRLRRLTPGPPPRCIAARPRGSATSWANFPRKPPRPWGFHAGLPVIAGGSDQGMAAVGAGILDPGDLLISVSTGGQLVAPLAHPEVDTAAASVYHVPRPARP